MSSPSPVCWPDRERLARVRGCEPLFPVFVNNVAILSLSFVEGRKSKSLVSFEIARGPVGVTKRFFVMFSDSLNNSGALRNVIGGSSCNDSADTEDLSMFLKYVPGFGRDGRDCTKLFASVVLLSSCQRSSV